MSQAAKKGLNDKLKILNCDALAKIANTLLGCIYGKVLCTARFFFHSEGDP